MGLKVNCKVKWVMLKIITTSIILMTVWIKIIYKIKMNEWQDFVWAVITVILCPLFSIIIFLSEKSVI